MNRKWTLGLGFLLTLALTSLFLGQQELEADEGPSFEVWAIDQSGTAGKLYIYNGKDMDDGAATAVPEVVDLGGAVNDLCVKQTGSTPVRAHMILFNASNTHAIISYVASGHVVFMDAANRTPIKCLLMSVGAKGARQAHAAFPAPDKSYVVVANQNGKLLERIDTDADNDGKPYEDVNDIAFDSAATLNLTTCTTPNKAPCEDPTLRPNNVVVCPVIDTSSRLVFVTLGGGMFVVDGKTTPMSIIAEYDKATVHPHGCGGIEKDGKMYINSGGFTGHPREADLYVFKLSDYPAAGFNSPNTPVPTVVFSKDGGDHDSHGMQLNKAEHGRYLWTVDRFANTIEVVDTTNDKLVNTFSLVGKPSSDPAPDLMDIAPNGKYAFITLRGPCPLTANDPTAKNAVGATPGVGVVAIEQGGLTGKLVAVAPITNPAPAGFDCPTRTDDAPGSITDQADPHGLRVRLKK